MATVLSGTIEDRVRSSAGRERSLGRSSSNNCSWCGSGLSSKPARRKVARTDEPHDHRRRHLLGDPAVDGVPDVLSDHDPDALPDRPGRPSAGVSTSVLEPVARRLPEDRGAAQWRLAVLNAENQKPGSGCSGPRWPPDRESGGT